MVSLFFGLPGCGKTTLLTRFALKGVKKYKNVYCNIDLNVPGVKRIINSDVGRYDLRDSLILIDEATLFAFSRNYKSIEFSLIRYMAQHRHFKVDVFFFSQAWDSLDKVIRTITDRVFFVYKGFLFRGWTYYYRIPYKIMFPDEKKGNSKIGEIIQGYSKPPFIVRLFKGRIRRKKYYKYFDSFNTYELPQLPNRTPELVYSLEQGIEQPYDELIPDIPDMEELFSYKKNSLIGKANK